MTRDEAIRKCKKLAAFESGRATPNEVAIAADLLRKMLRKYQLSMADLEGGLRDEGCVELELFVFKRIEPWRVHMVAVIAQCFDCKVLEKRYADGTKGAQIFGIKSDAEVTEYYIHAVIAASLPRANEIRRMVENIKGKSEANTYLSNYMIGVADGIAEQLREEPSASDERALVVTKDQLVEDFMRTRYRITRTKQTSPVKVRQSAYEHGLTEGRRTRVAPALARKE